MRLKLFSFSIFIQLALTAFSAQSQKAAHLSFPIYDNNIFLGELGATIVGNNVIAVDSDTFLRIMETKLNEETIDKLSKSRNDKQFNTVEQLKKEGIDLQLNFEELKLQMDIAPEKRISNIVNIRNNRNRYPDDATKPSFISGFVNGFFTQDYIHDSESKEEGRQSLNLTMDGALNVGGYDGVTLEAEAFYSESEQTPWTRGNVRLVHDDAQNALRYSFGDLSYQKSTLQSSPSMAGISIEKNFAELQPFRLVSSGSRETFTLERDATVRVYVNGALARTLFLNAGKVDLRDFPFIEGANEVRLEIEDSAGRIREIEFSSFFDSELLEKGLSEYSYNIGYLSSTEDNKIKYEDSNSPAISVFHRYGLTNWLTVGASAQGNDDSQQVGFETLLVNKLGSFSLQTAASQSDPNTSYAKAINFDWEYKMLNERQWDISVDFADKNFTSLGEATGSNPFVVDAQIRYQTPLPWEVNSSITLRHAEGRDDQEDLRSLGLTFNKNFGKILSFASFEAIEQDNADDEFKALLSFSWRLGEKQSISTRYNSESKNTTVEWSKFGSNTVGSWDANLAAERVENDYNFTGDIDYTANRFDIGYEHQWLSEDFDGNSYEKRSRFQLGTAIAFAGNKIGVGRPIDGSFALISKHKSLKGADISIDENSQGNPKAKLGGWLPVILPDIEPHRKESFDVKVSNLPLGYDIGDAEKSIFNTLGSGTNILVGSNASIVAIGTFVDSSGQHIKLSSGKVTKQDNSAISQTIFTNKKGRFVTQGLEAGEYNITLTNLNSLRYKGVLTVPEESIGYAKIGEITLTKE